MSEAINIYVNKFKERTPESKLRPLFEKYGNIIDFQAYRRYAYVIFETKEEGLEAIKHLNGYELNGCPLSVKIARKSAYATTPKCYLKKFLVTNLTKKTRAPETRKLFAKYGTVAHVKVRGTTAYVHLDCLGDPNDVVKELNGKVIDNKKIKVEISTSHTKLGRIGKAKRKRFSRLQPVCEKIYMNSDRTKIDQKPTNVQISPSRANFRKEREKLYTRPNPNFEKNDLNPHSMNIGAPDFGYSGSICADGRVSNFGGASASSGIFDNRRSGVSVHDNSGIGFNTGRGSNGNNGGDRLSTTTHGRDLINGLPVMGSSVMRVGGMRGRDFLNDVGNMGNNMMRDGGSERFGNELYSGMRGRDFLPDHGNMRNNVMCGDGGIFRERSGTEMRGRDFLNDRCYIGNNMTCSGEFGSSRGGFVSSNNRYVGNNNGCGGDMGDRLNIRDEFDDRRLRSGYVRNVNAQEKNRYSR